MYENMLKSTAMSMAEASRSLMRIKFASMLREADNYGKLSELIVAILDFEFGGYIE